MLVPKIFHFIYLFGPKTRQFDINHYLSVKSNIVVNNPLIVYIYTNNPVKLDKSKWINKLQEEFTCIRIEAVTEGDCKVDRMISPSPYMAHQADILRLKKLIERGGVYSDVDSIAYEPLTDLWELGKDVFCHETYDLVPESLCNGFFMATPGSNFLRDWLKAYDDYDPDKCKPGTPDWVRFSCSTGLQLLERKPYSVRILDPVAFQPIYLSYKDTQSLFLLDRMHCLESLKPYQVHTWETRNKDILKVLDEDYFKESNATYAQLGRKYLQLT